MSAGKQGFLSSLYRRRGGIKFGIGRIRQAFSESFRTALPVYHVAGTNGKGTTVCAITAMLRHLGFTTGTFVSPHILDYNERILYNGRKITDSELLSVMDEIAPEISNFDGLSFFEVTFLLAWRFFEIMAVDRVVLEVGLGGRLDATNVVDWPKIDIITSVGLDHTRVLGFDVSAIAAEKSGIIGRGDQVVVGPVPEVARRVIYRRAEQVGAVYDSPSVSPSPEDAQDDEDTDVPDTRKINFSLAAQAVETGERKTVSPEQVDITVPGRWEQLDDLAVLDVAHNVPAIAELVSFIRKRDERVVVLFGVLRDKNGSDVLSLLDGAACSVWAVSLSVFADRGCSADDILRMVPDSMNASVSVCESDEETMTAAVEDARKRGVRLLVTGSFHTVEKFVRWYRK